MSRQPNVFFHVGLPKTGTTYLQKLVFPNLKGISFYKKRLYDKHHQIIQDSTFDKYLFSCEFDKPLKERLLEIKTNYPNAKIIVCFRPQVNWITSRYRYHVRKFGGSTWKQFFSTDGSEAVWKHDELFYTDTVNFIRSHFPDEPLVLNFQLLKTNKDRFWEKIEVYTDTKLDRSFKNKVVKQNFDDKVLYTLRKFNAWRNYQHLSSKYPKLIRKIHYKLNELVLHIVVVWARLFSRPSGEFIPESAIEEIEKIYKEDWLTIEKLGE